MRIFLFLFIILLGVSCNNDSVDSPSLAKDESNMNTDSVTLRNLLINIYRWRDHQDILDYEIIDSNHLNIRLDTHKLANHLLTMKKTDFFSRDFLMTYKKIGMRIDSLIQNDSNYAEAGLIYFDFQDFNTWYGGQVGTPIFDNMVVLNFSEIDNKAFFKWAIPEELIDTVSVNFIFEDGKWKLNHLQYIDLKHYK